MDVAQEATMDQKLASSASSFLNFTVQNRCLFQFQNNVFLSRLLLRLAERYTCSWSSSFDSKLDMLLFQHFRLGDKGISNGARTAGVCPHVMYHVTVHYYFM